MKLNSVSLFYQHLKKFTLDCLHGVYGILIDDRSERTYYAKKISLFCANFDNKIEVDSDSIEEKFSCLFEQMSLFGGSRLIIVENLEKITEKSAKKLVQFYKNLDNETKLILSGSSFPFNIYNEDILCLDLSGEKPWDKKKRYVDEAISLSKSAGKNLNCDVANILIDMVGMNFSSLKNEIDKLVLFAPDDVQNISIDDVKKISTTFKEDNFWQIADDLVWENKTIPRPNFKNLSDWLALISQIRYFLYVAIELCQQITEDRPIKYKNLTQKRIDKYVAICTKVGVDHFINKLIKLFELELATKSDMRNPCVLWDLLVIDYSHDITFIT